MLAQEKTGLPKRWGGNERGGPSFKVRFPEKERRSKWEGVVNLFWGDSIPRYWRRQQWDTGQGKVAEGGVCEGEIFLVGTTALLRERN